MQNRMSRKADIINWDIFSYKHLNNQTTNLNSAMFVYDGTIRRVTWKLVQSSYSSLL